MAFIPWLLDLILSLLELFLSSTPSSNSNHDDDHSGAHQSPEQHSAALHAALEYFQLDSDTLTREAVKKKFRRLSLLHHPDRNSNSEEAKKTMQTINNYYNLLNEELDRREGIQHESEDEEEEADDEVDEPESPPRSPQADSPSGGKRGKKNKKNHASGKHTKAQKKRNRRARQRARKREQRQQEERNEEMQKEWEEVKRQQRQVRREQHQRKWKAHKTMQSHGLDTKEGRQRAYQEWKAAVDKMEEGNQKSSEENGDVSEAAKEPSPDERDEVPDLNDIDDDNAEPPASKVHATEESPKEASPSTANAVPVKPVNLVMECCMEDVVVALRLGNTDVVLDTIQSEIMEAFKDTMLNAFLKKRDEINEKEVAERIAKSFMAPLDEDGNTLLHYAVYYESSDTIAAVYHLASSFEILSEVFLKANAYKMTPLDFSKCCVKDTSIPARMKMYNDAANDDLATKQVWPSIKKSARRLWGILRNVNLAALHYPFNILFAYLIGARLFDCGRFVSLVCAVMSNFTGLAEKKMHPTVASALFTFHLTWRWCCYLFNLLSWNILFVLTVVVLLGYVATKSRLWFGIVIFPPGIVFLPVMCTLEAIEGGIKLPTIIKRDSEPERSVWLLLFTIGYLLAKMGLGRWYGVAEDGEGLFVADETLGEAVSFE